MGLFSVFTSNKNNKNLITNLQKFSNNANTSKDTKKEYNKLAKLINVFFSTKFQVQYKFTYEDLKYDLNELDLPEYVSKRTGKLLDQLNDLEFDKDKINSEILINISKDMVELVQEMDYNKFDYNKIKQESSSINIEEKKIDIVNYSDDMFLPPNYKNDNKDKTNSSEKLVETKNQIKEKYVPKSIITNKKDEIKLEDFPEPKIPDPNDLSFVPKPIKVKKEDSEKKLMEPKTFQPPKPESYEKEFAPKGYDIDNHVDNDVIKEPNPIKIANEKQKIDLKKETFVEIAKEPKDFTSLNVKEPKPITNLKKIKIPVPKIFKKNNLIKSSEDTSSNKPDLPSFGKMDEHTQKLFDKIETIKKEPIVAQKSVTNEDLPSFAVGAIYPKKEEIVNLVTTEPTTKKNVTIKQTKNSKQKKSIPKINVKPIKKDLDELIQELEQNKNELRKEITLLDKEENIIRQEKDTVPNKKLPEFNLFHKTIDNELIELSHKKEILEKKEALIQEKLDSLKKIEHNLTNLSVEVKQDHKSIKDTKKFIKAKETVIKKIKLEIKAKYNEAIHEVDNLKHDLKDKENKFLLLQKFYNNREQKLHTEESNLITEKRKYSKIVSNLILNHLESAQAELNHINDKIGQLKLKDKLLDKDLAQQELNKKYIQDEKELIRTTILSKKKYFAEVENAIKEKDPAFEELIDAIALKQDQNVELQDRLMDYEKLIDDARHETRIKTQNLELRDLDLKSINKEIDRLRLDINNHELRLNIRQKQLQKRIDTYLRLRKDVNTSISREKKAIDRMEKRLGVKSSAINSKLSKIKKVDDYYSESMNEMVMKNDGDTIVREITFKHHYPNNDIGNPYVLDILKLLNKAKVFINTNQRNKSRDTYLEVQRLFENLGEEDREELYGEIVTVFKEKPAMQDMQRITPVLNTNIDNLIREFESSVASGNSHASGDIYQQLQQTYLDLPKEHKGKYYNRIMNLYSKVATSSSVI
jgi:hypothetical protein